MTNKIYGIVFFKNKDINYMIDYVKSRPIKLYAAYKKKVFYGFKFTVKNYTEVDNIINELQDIDKEFILATTDTYEVSGNLFIYRQDTLQHFTEKQYRILPLMNMALVEGRVNIYQYIVKRMDQPSNELFFIHQNSITVPKMVEYRNELNILIRWLNSFICKGFNIPALKIEAEKKNIINIIGDITPRVYEEALSYSDKLVADFKENVVIETNSMIDYFNLATTIRKSNRTVVLSLYGNMSFLYGFKNGHVVRLCTNSPLLSMINYLVTEGYLNPFFDYDEINMLIIEDETIKEILEEKFNYSSFFNETCKDDIDYISSIYSLVCE